MMDLIGKGGWTMYLLALVALVATIFIIERLIVYTKATLSAKKFLVDFKAYLVQGDLDAAIEACEATPGPVPAIMRAGLLKYQQTNGDMIEVEKAIESVGTTELAFLEKNLIFLVTAFTIGPMIGFLGTVTGMIHAFDAIAAAGTVEATVVASGISEALITTASGLTIAIPVKLFYDYFTAKVTSIVLNVEESTREFIELLKTQKS